MEELLTEVTPTGVMTLTLNRPETLNSLSAEMTAAVIEAVERASADEAIRAIVLTGAGRGFCSGANAARRAQGEGTGPGSGRSEGPRRQTIPEAFSASRVPIIGAVNGPAAGAGFGIALACDVRLIGESGRMGPIFIKRGIGTDNAVAFWLPRIVGYARAVELLYDGNLLDAHAAVEVGLASRVVPDDDLLPQALELAERIAAGAPLAYAGTRQQVLRSMQGPATLSEFMDFEWKIQGGLLETEDALEGFRSFVEQRPPQFQGR